MTNNADPKLLVFVCRKASSPNNDKVAYRIASALVKLGIAEIGDLSKLSMQHALPIEAQGKMLFLNECRAGCVRTLTHGFIEDNYIYFDIHWKACNPDFNIEHYVEAEIIPQINEKWRCRHMTSKV